jgi:RNA polymerase sigma factor (sigma-70 family)
MLRAPRSTEPGDGRLLQRFVQERDEAVFGVLVRRHGPLVLGVCRRILGNEQDAEDASQAAFFVLARRAGALDRRNSVAPWLYTVAYRLALRARAAAARRRLHERHAAMSRAEATDVTPSDVRSILDEELQRLPERYRAPLVLCYLQEKTNAEAARELGWPAGSMSRRLARGRELLRRRLARRGVTLACLCGAAPTGSSLAAVPGPLLQATVRAAAVFAVGGNPTAAAAAVGLARGALRALTVTRAVLALAGALGLMLADVGALAALPQAPPRTGPAPAAAPEAEQAAAPPRADRYGDLLPAGVLARLGTVRWRSIGLSHLLIFSPDDRVLASVCWDRAILWDASTGRPLHRLPPASGPVAGGAFTPDGKTLLLLPDASGNIVFWDVATGKRLRTLFPPGAQPGARFGYGLSLSPDGSRLAVRDGAGNPLLLDAVSGRVVHALGATPSGFCNPAFTPDGKLVAFPGDAPRIRLWDVATGKVVRGIDGPRNPYFQALSFSPDGKTLVWEDDDSVVLDDVSTGKEIGRLDARGRVFWSVRFTPDGKALVSGGFDGKVRVWDVVTRKQRATLNSRSWPGATGIALSHDGKRVAEGFQGNSAIRLWDVATGQELFTDYEGHADPVCYLTFTADGRALLTGDLEGQLRQWDAATWKPVRTWEAGRYGLALDARGKRVATADYRIVRVRDTVTGAESCKVEYPEQEPTYAGAFARDGRCLACLALKHRQGPGADTYIDLWDTADGHRIRRVSLPEFDISELDVIPGFRPLMVTPDGRVALVCDGPGILRAYDLEEGRQLFTLSGHRRYADTLALSADGTLLASGSLDRTVRLWDLASAHEIATLRGHRRAVAAVALSADGRLVASADGVRVRSDRGVASHRYDDVTASHQVRVWDAATGTEVGHFEGHATDVSALAFAPDGRRLVAGRCDGSVLVWDLTTLPPLPALELPAGGLDALWQDLAGSDAGRAHRAAWTFATHPGEALPYLKERVRAVPVADARQLGRLIADLDSDRFEARSAAVKELEALGEQAAPALRTALAGRPSAEVRKQAEALLAGLRLVRSSEVLRRLRAIAVLERIGSPEARADLDRVAHGAAGARETRAARDALERLGSPR